MIEARGLVKRYGSTTAVDNLSFDVRPGTVTGFLGPNGAGKSTTMRMILNIIYPDQGSIRVFGREVQAGRSSDRETPVGNVRTSAFARHHDARSVTRVRLSGLCGDQPAGIGVVVEWQLRFSGQAHRKRRCRSRCRDRFRGGGLLDCGSALVD